MSRSQNRPLKRCMSCGIAKDRDDFKNGRDPSKASANCRACELKAGAKPRRPRGSGSVKDAKIDSEIVKLVKMAHKPITFSDLCNSMDLSPRKLETLIGRALKQHAPLHVEHDTVSLAPSLATELVQASATSRAVGSSFSIGVVSDTHLGSKYCLRGALRETIQWMYDCGIRDILHPGDVLEGCYPHAQYELSHSGFDAQLQDAAKCFPEFDDMLYHFISGNHDHTFESRIGMRAAVAIEQGMRARGRDDWRAYGARSAYVNIGGAVINLYHPSGSGAYARSYHLQKRIEGYTTVKPQILLMGHFHQFGYVYERGVHGIMCPSFQGSGSDFAQSLKGSPAIGGMILSWQLNEHNRLHHLEIKPRFFYENENILEARNAIDAEALVPVGRDQRFKGAKQ